MNYEEIYKNLPTLETERLILRKIREDDARDMYAYGSDEVVSKYVTWDRHQTIHNTMEFIQFVLDRYETGQIAPWGIQLKETGTFIGTIDFVNWNAKHKWSELGYVLARPLWGNGIITEAAKRLLEFGFNETDVERIQARCFQENIGSEKVMQKIGMTFEGTLRHAWLKKGKYHNIKVYSILREEYMRLRNWK